jgi:hypothetical protein
VIFILFAAFVFGYLTYMVGDMAYQTTVNHGLEEGLGEWLLSAIFGVITLAAIHTAFT